MFVFVFFTGIALLLSALLECCKRVPIFQKLNRKLKDFFHWNFVIRLVLEGALEISFCAYLQLRFGQF